MRTLTLLRHAKSAWDDESLDDFDRPLAPRGRKAAARVGRHLRKTGAVPDLALVSAAARARETWDRVVTELGAAPPSRHLRSLYLAAPSRMIEVIRRQPDSVGHLLLCGHNPGLEGLAARLVGSGPADERAAMAAKYPTGAVARIAFDVDAWDAVAPGTGRLESFVLPRKLD